MTVANTQRGYVEIELDKVRQIRFDLNALAELEEALGITVDQLGDVAAKHGMKGMRTLLWVGLKQDDPELTEHQVGAMIDITNIGRVGAALTEAFGAAAGKPGNGKAGAGGPGIKPRR